MKQLISLAEQLVLERIPGHRKGSDEPASAHSFRVAQILRTYRYNVSTCLAGLLHDLVEDSETTLDELLSLGFPDRVVRLVDLCSHNESISGADARWVRMMGRLVDADDPDAWAIKAADILDNVRSSHTLPSDRGHFMRTVKAPMFLSLTKQRLGKTRLWKELERETVETV